MTRIDPATGIGTNFELGTPPAGLAFDGTSIWVAGWGDHTVKRIDPATGVATSFPLPTGATGPYGVAFDGTDIWVTNKISENVSRIDPTTGVGVNIALVVDGGPTALAFDGTSMWIANTASPALMSKIPASDRSATVQATWTSSSAWRCSTVTTWIARASAAGGSARR